MAIRSAKNFKNVLLYVVVFVVACSFYTLTRASNHAESYDSLTYALFAENFPLGTAPDSRNILFQAFNRIVYCGSQSLGLNIDALDLIIALSLVTGSLSLILFSRLMQNSFGVSPIAAWMGSAFLGLAYGYWRYTGAAEVYVPSIFLVLCCLTTLCRYFDKPGSSHWRLILASILAGIAVLFYQPNLLALFIAVPVLFLVKFRFIHLFAYWTIAGLVVLAGVVSAYAAMAGHVPTTGDLFHYVVERNSEFRTDFSLPKAAVKLTLAGGHDVLSAHWTRTLEPVKSVLDGYIPGCVYNFEVVFFAGKGIEYLTAIAAILFIPICVLFARLWWIASSQWRFSKPTNRNLFLLAWFLIQAGVVGLIDPGSFEASIPALVPFACLLTVFVFEPCLRAGKKRTVMVFLVLMLSYNYFGGMLIWQNTGGDYYRNKTTWIRQELTEHDYVLLNEYDYRFVDYLTYNSDATIAHLTGADHITIDRGSPDISYHTIQQFFIRCRSGQHRIFVMDDVLEPCAEIKECRGGEEKYAAAVALSVELKGKTKLVAEDKFGNTYQLDPATLYLEKPNRTVKLSTKKGTTQ